MSMKAEDLAHQPAGPVPINRFPDSPARGKTNLKFRSAALKVKQYNLTVPQALAFPTNFFEVIGFCQHQLPGKR